MKLLTHQSSLLLLSLVLCACDSAVVWKDGPYQVQWIDVFQNRSLGYVEADGLWISRIGREIKKVGSNTQYIVAEQYDPNTSSTRYFYIVRQEDEGRTDLSPAIKGPYNFEEFSILKKEKNLPEFSDEF